MPHYTYYPTKKFTDRLDKIKHRDPQAYSRINEVIDRLLENPGAADGRMHGNHHGLFKKYVGRGDYRLIYYYCELCRKQNQRLEEKCRDCDIVEDNTVIFFEVYHKNEKKKLKDVDF
jgi:mRNA-degrading endonuclease RelE of RelBE toxin-antitoxin system